MAVTPEQQPSSPDSRPNAQTRLAIERTLLAWIRTGLAMMGFGFVLDRFGFFLRELSQRAPALSALLTPHLGDGFADRKGEVTRMAALMNSAPALDPANLNQVAALPLGTRVKLNPWDGHAELIKGTPVAFTSAREKMPLEVTPFFPRLTRLNSNDSLGTAATAASK